jgi:hemoglobin
MMSARRLLAPLLIVLPLLAGAASAQERTLYQRLGGYDGLVAIVDDFGMRISTDQRFQRFFSGTSRDSQMRQRQLLLDLFCQLTGGPCTYIGRDLKVAHGGLGITKAEWDTVSKMFVEAMAKLKVGEREQQEFGALIAPREKDIVEKGE